MRYTPQTIVKANQCFSIPLYQRLFEWDEDNIIQLLHDLLKSFENSRDEDYFVGMLTSAENQLVDGQQRFTAIMLIGCVMQTYSTNWKDFIFSNGRLRLSFISRDADQKYLEKLALKQFYYDGELVNYKMHDAINAINNFMRELEVDKEKYALFVFQHLCFFISELPSKYSPLDLNKYFERMNSSGKNLERHEILKVKLLSKLEGSISLYMQIWNKISDVDTLLIRKGEKESENDYSSRKNQVISYGLQGIIDNIKLINGLNMKNNDSALDTNLGLSIKELSASQEKPNTTRHYNNGSRSVIRFPQLLLLTLYYYLRKKNVDIKSLEHFFDVSKLLETFTEYLPYEGKQANSNDLKAYFEQLILCRTILDVCFVRSMEHGYSLDMNTSEEDVNTKELMMFESFLYVSSSNLTNYHWFEWLISNVESQRCIPSAKDLFYNLKKHCDEEHPLPRIEDLNYNTDIRYWFWRLDFVLWQKREILFKDNEHPEYLQVAENYVFIRNRSIEHIAPQHPKTESKLQWNENISEDKFLLDSFGNLVMISQGLNSALSNSSYEEKMAHVQSYFQSVNGTIESLKLLMAYKEYQNKWDKDSILVHGKSMYELLNRELKSNGTENKA
jgi:hypothetical protein